MAATLAASLGELVITASLESLHSRRRRRIDDGGVDFLILARLWLASPNQQMFQNVLADSIQVAVGVVSRVSERLAKQGFVVRAMGGPRNAVRLELTEVGKKYIAREIQSRCAMQFSLLDSLCDDDQERARLIAILQKLGKRLHNHIVSPVRGAA